MLSVDGSKVDLAKRDIHAGLRPFAISMAPSGDIAVVTNLGMGGGDHDTISVIDLKAKPARVVETVTAGPGPEGLAISANGAYAAGEPADGSARAADHPAFHDHGIVRVFRIDGHKLTPVAEAKVGRWGQGVAWSKDNRTLLVQTMIDKEIAVLSFDGKELKRTGAIKINGGPAGLRTAGP